MKYKLKTPIIEAEQWYRDKKVEGVSGDDPNKLCGCVMLGVPHSSSPHTHVIHGLGISTYLVDNGDFIVKAVDGNGYVPINAEEFLERYERVD